MCNHWQYDFTECGCWYWASSKPDIVSSADGKYPYLDFQRKVELRTDPPTIDTPNYIERTTKLQLTHQDMFSLPHEFWNKLPVVINGRETEQIEPSTHLTIPSLMNRNEVIEELRYLAKVEHALCLEYLYAHYSLNCPPYLPITHDDYSINKQLDYAKIEGNDDQTKRIFAAAKEIFMIALDEMRHFHWVNQALGLLGSNPSVDRADTIGRSQEQPFELRPLTKEQLQWFVDIEKPSQSLNEDQIDGMYVRLHLSIDRQPELFPEHDRLVTLLKLIIDEGGDHYQRFLSIQTHLEGIDPDIYLRKLKDPIQGSDFEKLQNLCDTNYALVVGTLEQSFSLGEKAGGILLEQARRAMFNLHETSNYLVSKGIDIHYRTSSIVHPVLPFTAQTAHEHINKMSFILENTLLPIKELPEVTEKTLALQQERTSNALFASMHKLIEEELE